MLCIEYDVSPQGEIELVALVNAVEEDGEDPDGRAWLAWRATHEDGGMGCAPVRLPICRPWSPQPAPTP